MSFAPVGSWTWLLVIGLVLVILRVSALYRILAQPPSSRRGRTLVRWTGLTLAVLFVMVAAARPGVDTGREVSLAVDSPGSANVNVFLVVDRSEGSPVPAMRADIAALIDRYSEARFALISFATRATMDWPVSEDVSGLRSVVAGLTPYVATTPEQALQTNAFAARDVLRAAAETAAAQYPGSRNLVFYLGTGDPESLVSRGSFEMSAGTVADGGVLGYGTTDEPRLQQIADQLGVPYTPRLSGQPLGDVGPTLEATDTTSGESLQVADRRELYWLFMLLAAALILAEIALTLREYHKNRLSRRELKV